MKLWGGRFEKETNQMVDDFHSSISFDKRLYPQDIRGSMAHAKMLCKQGIISQEDEAAIQQGLAGILADMQAGKVDRRASATRARDCTPGAAATTRWPPTCTCTPWIPAARQWPCCWIWKR